MAVALFCFTQRVYPICYEYKKLAALAVLAAVTVVISKMMGGSVGLKIVLLVCYPLLASLILRRKTA